LKQLNVYATSITAIKSTGIFAAKSTKKQRLAVGKALLLT
jgi:hypothetical protein